MTSDKRREFEISYLYVFRKMFVNQKLERLLGFAFCLSTKGEIQLRKSEIQTEADKSSDSSAREWVKNEF